MDRIIDYIEAESLSKFTETANRILDSKKELALETEKLEAGLDFFKEDMDGDCDYEEEDPNFDVEIDPENFDENDMTDLESAIWEDDDLLDDVDEEIQLTEEELELTYEQMVYALERFEELDELSKKTLVNYVKKSSADAQHQRERAAKARNASQELANAEYANRTQTSRNSSTKYNRHQHDSVFDHPEVKDAVRKASSAIEKDATRRQHNREYGQYRAIKKLTKEQVEHLEELSKKTLGSYINKASGRMYGYGHEKASRQADYDEKYRKLNDVDHNADMETKGHIRKVGDGLMKHHNREQSKTAKKAYNRDQGIKRAVHRLTKEEIEHLEELSKGALARYKLKATDNGNKQADRMFGNKDKTKKAQNNTMRKWINREKGLDRAEKKLNEKD